VAFVEEDFGGKVLWRAAEGIGACFAVLGEAEISKLEIAFLVNENVLWLQVSVDDLLGVEILKHEDNLG